MKASGLGSSPRKLLEEMKEIKSLDFLLPAKDRTITLRVVSTLRRLSGSCFKKTRIVLPSKQRIITNVV